MGVELYWRLLTGSFCVQVWRERLAWQRSLPQEARLTLTHSRSLYRKPCPPTHDPCSFGSCHLLTQQVRSMARTCKDTRWKQGTVNLLFELLSSGTFKIQKMRLQREGYKPQESREDMYFLNSRAGSYEPVTDELYSAIMEGEVCLWGRTRDRWTVEEESMNCIFQSERKKENTRIYFSTSNDYILINPGDSGNMDVLLFFAFDMDWIPEVLCRLSAELMSMGSSFHH